MAGKKYMKKEIEAQKRRIAKERRENGAGYILAHMEQDLAMLEAELAGRNTMKEKARKIECPGNPEYGTCGETVVITRQGGVCPVCKTKFMKSFADKVFFGMGVKKGKGYDV